MTESIVPADALKRAIALHLAGRFPEAERLYRAILDAQPRHPEANCNIAELAMLGGKPEKALPHFKTALEADPSQGQYWLNYADALIGSGMPDVAQQVLVQGRLRGLAGPAIEALAARANAAAQVKELFAEAVAHHQAGRLDSAGAIYRQILDTEPNHPGSLNFMGMIVHQNGRPTEAESIYRRALEIKPDFAQAHNNLGNVLKDLGRLAEAEESYRRALTIEPDSALTLGNLGNALNALNRPKEAEACCRKALEIDPDSAVAHNNLGNALEGLDRPAEAEASYRRALEIDPDFAEAHNNLGNVLKGLEHLSEAVASYRRALEIRPDFAIAHNNLGNALGDLGRSAEAEACFRRALEIGPDIAVAHSNLLLTMFTSCFDGAAILAQAKRFDAACGAPFRARLAARYRNVPDPERRLRIGFLSPSLTDHVTANVLGPILRAHRRDRVSIHVYAHVPRPDAATWRLKESCDAWTFVHEMSDDQAAARIEQDGIDILVDPMGHWKSNRLPVFARKPAPIQMTYLCQGLTTGLSAIDYAIGDRWMNEGGAMQAFATERVIELASGYGVNTVFLAPPIGPPPSAAAGFVTYGSFNNPAKISDRTLDLWSAVLRRRPTARLLIKGRLMDQPEARALLSRRLEDRGIAAERTDLFGFVATTADHLDWYNRIDIVLDTLPFCGGHTTAEALWMGVPVVTRIGDTMVGRYSYSHLSRLGAPELIARDDDAFVDIAVALADDLPRLRRYRREFRDIIRTSPLFSVDAHVAELEQAYRLMWRRWCAGSPPSLAL